MLGKYKRQVKLLTAPFLPVKLKNSSGPCLWGIWRRTCNNLTEWRGWNTQAETEWCDTTWYISFFFFFLLCFVFCFSKLTQWKIRHLQTSYQLNYKFNIWNRNRPGDGHIFAKLMPIWMSYSKHIYIVAWVFLPMCCLVLWVKWRVIWVPWRSRCNWREPQAYQSVNLQCKTIALNNDDHCLVNIRITLATLYLWLLLYSVHLHIYTWILSYYLMAYPPRDDITPQNFVF